MKKGSVKKAAEAIISKARRIDQKQRLTAWNELCEKIIANKSELSVASLVRQMTNNGYTLSKRTVYNDSPSNHYQSIYKLWSDYKITLNVNINNAKKDIVDTDYLYGVDLSKISDPVTRYQVSLMIGQLKSFKQQLDLATQVQENFVLSVGDINKHLENKTQDNKLISQSKLSNYDSDLLKELLRNRLFEFDENGKMISASSIRKGMSLTSEGFKQMIEKLMSE